MEKLQTKDARLKEIEPKLSDMFIKSASCGEKSVLFSISYFKLDLNCKIDKEIFKEVKQCLKSKGFKVKTPVEFQYFIEIC